MLQKLRRYFRDLFAPKPRDSLLGAQYRVTQHGDGIWTLTKVDGGWLRKGRAARRENFPSLAEAQNYVQNMLEEERKIQAAAMVRSTVYLDAEGNELPFKRG